MTSHLQSQRIFAVTMTVIGLLVLRPIQVDRGRIGLSENDGNENDGPPKLQDIKLQDVKLTDQVVGLEIAGH